MENKFKIILCLFGIFNSVYVESKLYMQTVGNKEIYFNNETMNWYEAFQTCASHGLQLLTINSGLENFQISEFVKGFSNHIHIWTSGTDAGNEGDWAWMSNGKTFKETYSYWFGIEPNNQIRPPCSDENCLMVALSENERCWYWNDDPCTFIKHSICEKP